jgi:hypothetical protein
VADRPVAADPVGPGASTPVLGEEGWEVTRDPPVTEPVASGVDPGSTWMVTPSLPLTPLAITSITSRTEFPAPTTGLAGRMLISRIASSVAAEDAGMGTVSAPAASETRRRLLIMTETVGTTR